MGVPAVELKGITKTFGSIVANSDCSLTVEKGEILSVCLLYTSSSPRDS